MEDEKPREPQIVKQHQAKAAQLATESADWEKRKEKWLAVLAGYRISEGIDESIVRRLSVNPKFGFWH